jgi:hypothetical protein
MTYEASYTYMTYTAVFGYGTVHVEGTSEYFKHLFIYIYCGY